MDCVINRDQRRQCCECSDTKTLRYDSGILSQYAEKIAMTPDTGDKTSAGTGISSAPLDYDNALRE